MLWPLPDPISGEGFAGDPEEMVAAQRWREAMVDLKVKAKTAEPGGSDDGDENRNNKKRGKCKIKGATPPP